MPKAGKKGREDEPAAATRRRDATADMPDGCYRCPGGIYQHGGSTDETDQGYGLEFTGRMA